MPDTTPEHQRLAEDAARTHNWKRWGPYLSERQWGTVREDYSADGDAWNYLPHEHARSRAYRWGEDGLLGWTDRECRLAFALALWNGRDPILKERLFGLSNPQGNHGEDVKECYFYLDSTPTHSYAKALYKYPAGANSPTSIWSRKTPAAANSSRSTSSRTPACSIRAAISIFLPNTRRPAPDDTCIRLTVCNRGPDAATLHLLPTFWFRNTWTWGCTYEESCWLKPKMQQHGTTAIAGAQATLGDFRFEIETPAPWLFTENETNNARLFGAENASPYVKDAFHEYVVHGRARCGEPRQRFGTKAAAHYRLERSRPGDRDAADAAGLAPRSRAARSRQAVSAASTRSWPPASGRRMSTTRHVTPRSSPRSSGTSCARPTPACSGQSNITTTSSASGWTATPSRPSRPPERLEGTQRRLAPPLQ